MRPHSTNYWIGSSCNGGGVFVISKYIKSGHFVIICDDCESIWNHPDISDDDRWTKTREPGEIKNAILEEIQSLGFDKYIEGNFPD